MICSKKGVESFPFFLFLTLLIAAFVIVIGFYQIQVFSTFSNQKQLSDDYNQMMNAMETLRSTADIGSYKRVNMRIPAGGKLVIYTNDTIIINTGTQQIENKVGFDILYTTVNELTAGNYELVVYYGNYTGEPERYAIYFV